MRLSRLPGVPSPLTPDTAEPPGNYVGVSGFSILVLFSKVFLSATLLTPTVLSYAAVVVAFVGDNPSHPS